MTLGFTKNHPSVILYIMEKYEKYVNYSHRGHWFRRKFLGQKKNTPLVILHIQKILDRATLWPYCVKNLDGDIKLTLWYSFSRLPDMPKTVSIEN